MRANHRNQDASASRVSREPRAHTAALVALLSFGVVLWQHLLHETTVIRSNTSIWEQMPHVMRDAALALPIAFIAVVVGRNIAKAFRSGGSASSTMLRAAVTTEVFMLGMLVGVPLHGPIDSLFGGAHVDEGALLVHAVRDAFVGQFAAFPLMLLGLVVASNPSHAFSRGALTRAVVVLSSVVALSVLGVGGAAVFMIALVVGGFIWLDNTSVVRSVVVLSLVAATLAIPGPLGLDDGSVAQAADANGCELGANLRSYDVAAINIDMQLNAFGDHDPTAMMFVLENRIADVRAQEASGTVSPGLRTDAIQPLSIRANVGECLEINFTNRLTNGLDASFSVHGLAHTSANAGGNVGNNPDGNVSLNQTITYRYPVPADSAAEGSYQFHSHVESRQTMAHGLFGVLTIEPAGSTYLDPETAGQPLESGWEAIIVDPAGIDFREFVIMLHEVGDEDFVIFDVDDNDMPVIDPITGSYRPGSRAINYRSEPFRDRLILGADKSLAYSSYTFGDPATPIPRSYLGEPTKTRLVHPGSEMFHVYHLHGGGDRWKRNPNADAANFAGGLDKEPVLDAQSTRMDSQALGPSEGYSLEHECGAGGCQQAAGDFLFHCHIGSHYVSGMWAFWRVFDTEQTDLALMPADPGYVAPSVQQSGTSLDLIGTVVEGQTLVAAVDADLATETAIEDFIAAQLPPQGVTLDDQDATVWDWQLTYVGNDPTQPLFLGEPETNDSWANYTSSTPGARPELLFNLGNGRQTWPQFKPHLGKRPPFAPNGHGGTPWLGADGTATRPDGLCPSDTAVPGRRILNYPLSGIDIPIQVSPTDIDLNGKLYVLNEDIAEVRAGTQTAEPIVLRSNVGDCTDILLTSQQEDINHGGFAKLNLHTHFVQFDPQASDGVITGFSYEQSVRPYSTEDRTLDVATTVGETVLQVSNVSRLRVGISIGVGLGEGMCDVTTGAPVANPDHGDRPCTEIRTITALGGSNTITLDAPLQNTHAAGDAVGVEFVQYRWYSDVDSGTVFFHDHVDFKNWDHGLFGAHIIEPAGSTWRDPVTGVEVRTGTIADIHASVSESIGAGQSGSFRELMLFLSNSNDAIDPLGGDGTALLNMRAEPLANRNGDFPFSSVENGDPVTPILRSYVGDDVVVRGLGVVERISSLRLSGHRFRQERFNGGSRLMDTVTLGISEREDLILDGGAGGPSGIPGDYMLYNTSQLELEQGAWGLVRVHDTAEVDLQPLPGSTPPGGAGFPQQTFTGAPPLGGGSAVGSVCPGGTPVVSHNVALFDLPASPFGSSMYSLSADRADILSGAKTPVPLVLRVNEGQCLRISLTNFGGKFGGMNVAKLLSDPQVSSGLGIGFNTHSMLDTGQTRVYEFFADSELGTSMFFNLAEPTRAFESAYGAIIVEPAGSSYRNPVDGTPVLSGVIADILTPTGGFREFAVLLQDEDGELGQNTMPYPTEVSGFTGINYTGDPFRVPLLLTGRLDVNPDPALVFDSATHGDPNTLFQAYTGDEVRIRVGVGTALQTHVFGIDGHRFPWEPDVAGSEQLSARAMLAHQSFDVELIDGAGAGIATGADYLLGDYRMPFLEAGSWGILRTHDTPQAGLLALPTAATGFLRVVTSPPVRSQITVDGTPNDTWALDWAKIPVGAHEVCFSDVEGFTTPPCQNVVVNPGVTTNVTGSFAQRGFLRVDTNPPAPATISIDGVPRDDWQYWTDVAPGFYDVCFGAVLGLLTPGCQNVEVVAGAETFILGDFSTANPAELGPSGHGLLRAVTSPAVPSQLTVNGLPAGTWALDWAKMAPGSYDVCWSDVEGWSTPGCQTVAVVAGQVTNVTGSFSQRGFLKVDTNPPTQSTISIDGIVADDWQVWTDLVPGNYNVCFGEANGTTPGCFPATVIAGNTTNVVGNWP